MSKHYVIKCGCCESVLELYYFDEVSGSKSVKMFPSIEDAIKAITSLKKDFPKQPMTIAEIKFTLEEVPWMGINISDVIKKKPNDVS